MRILITNITLAWRTGTEIVTRDLALQLKRRGHDPIVYTPEPGPIADEIRAGGVDVVDSLDGVSPPDVIHAHHAQPCVAAALRFPSVPVLFVCHDAHSFYDEVPPLPQIGRFVGVDDACRERLVNDGAPESRLAVVLNAVDLERFTPRGPLPRVAIRAAVFSNSAAQVPAVREACERLGIALDVVGAASGDGYHDAPEAILGRYDIVFAKARSALEAAAVGCAVVLCDAGGLGPLLDPANVKELRRLNFGFRTLTEPVSPQAVAERLARYSPVAAAEVSEWTRSTAGLDDFVAQYEALYDAVVLQHVPPDPLAVVGATARWLEKQSPRLGLHAASERAREQMHAVLVDSEARLAELNVRLEDTTSQLAELAARHADLAETFAFLASSPLIRLRNRLGRLPLIGAAMRGAGRGVRRLLPMDRNL